MWTLAARVSPQPHASRRSAPFRGAAAANLKSQPMATGCSPLSAFVFISEPLGRRHAVGVSKSSELSRVSAPITPNTTGMPDGPLRRAIDPESRFGREDSCFLHHSLSAYAHARVGRGALVGRVGRPTGISSALLNGCGSGTANPYRSYSADEQLAKKNPADVDGATGY
jgi:hypothetical protein